MNIVTRNGKSFIYDEARNRYFPLGKGKFVDAVMNTITGDDPVALKLLLAILDNPEASDQLFELMLLDMGREPKPKKAKVRRGVGSY